MLWNFSVENRGEWRREKLLNSSNEKNKNEKSFLLLLLRFPTRKLTAKGIPGRTLIIYDAVINNDEMKVRKI